MSNSNNAKDKFIKFISGNGFYAVLAVCLIGAGAAAWVAVDRTIDSIEKNNTNISQNQSSIEPNWDFSKVEETKKPQSGVEVNSSKASSLKKASSESSKSVETKKDVETEENKSEKAGKAAAPLTYVMPIEGEIFNQFSDGKLVKDITLNEWRTHNGIDIKADEKTKVQAVTDGTISKIYTDKVWGSVVEITHADGVTAVYAGVVADSSLKEGDTVKMKQIIGESDKIPCEIALDAHIHFAMSRDGNWINPLKHMNKLK